MKRTVALGTVTAYDPRFVVWERRRVEAVRDAGASHAEFLAALEGYVKSLRDRQRLAELAVRQAAAPGVELLEAKYHVLEAERWLNREKAR